MALPRTTVAPVSDAELRGDIARVIGRRPLFFVCALVLLIHDDQPQPLDRREERRTRADDHIHFARADAPPLVQPLAVGQSAVQQRDPTRETSRVARHRLWRQRDLRHQRDAPLAPRDHRRERLKVDLGLAAAGDAMQQERSAAGLRACQDSLSAADCSVVREVAAYEDICARRGDRAAPRPLR